MFVCFVFSLCAGLIVSDLGCSNSSHHSVLNINTINAFSSNSNTKPLQDPLSKQDVQEYEKRSDFTMMQSYKMSKDRLRTI